MRPVTLLLKMYSPQFFEHSFALLDAAVGGISDIPVRVLLTGDLALMMHKVVHFKLTTCPHDDAHTMIPTALKGLEIVAP